MQLQVVWYHRLIGETEGATLITDTACTATATSCCFPSWHTDNYPDMGGILSLTVVLAHWRILTGLKSILSCVRKVSPATFYGRNTASGCPSGRIATRSSAAATRPGASHRNAPCASSISLVKNALSTTADPRCRLTGTCGCGKTYVGCALGNNACHQGYSVQCWRLSRLLVELTHSRADGSYRK